MDKWRDFQTEKILIQEATDCYKLKEKEKKKQTQDCAKRNPNNDNPS